jgi:hypothetical protein
MNKENVLRVAAALAQLSCKNLKEGKILEAAWCDNGAQLLSRVALDSNR